MNKNDEYLIGELAERAGVSVRTIRYYISEGLLPSPEVRGRYSVYDEDYLQRIRLIMRLKEAYLPIKEIRKKLETETEEEILSFLAMFESTQAQKNEALSYIASVKEPKADQRLKMMRMPPAPANMDSAPISPQSRGISSSEDSSWRRMEIVPGMELHINEKMYAHLEREVQALIVELKRRFNKNV